MTSLGLPLDSTYDVPPALMYAVRKVANSDSGMFHYGQREARRLYPCAQVEKNRLGCVSIKSRDVMGDIRIEKNSRSAGATSSSSSIGSCAKKVSIAVKIVSRPVATLNNALHRCSSMRTSISGLSLPIAFDIYDQ
jgi:hypothetical protein